MMGAPGGLDATSGGCKTEHKHGPRTDNYKKGFIYAGEGELGSILNCPFTECAHASKAGKAWLHAYLKTSSGVFILLALQ